MSNYKPYPIANPFLQYIGAKFIYADKSGCHLQLNITPNLINSWDVGHGGALVTLMDTAMSWAARFYVEPNIGVATIEIKSSFFASSTGIINCFAQVVHKTSTMAFCEAYIENEQNKIVSKASATFKYLRKLPI